MINRRKCESIARRWVGQEAEAEYHRRCKKFRIRIPESHMTPERLSGLEELAISAHLAGLYDPPRPKIPNAFRRLWMNDWTPPERTDDMYTGKEKPTRLENT